VSPARDTFVFMAMRYRRRHRTGLAAAAAAFVVATGAVVTSGLALAHPIEPGRHIVTWSHRSRGAPPSPGLLCGSTRLSPNFPEGRGRVLVVKNAY
jgi:hypothetical protein